MDEEQGFRYSRPSPRKEDVLFASDSSLWQMEADLEFRPGNDYAYRQGYRLAGRILTESIAKDRFERDFLVFPICHSYRHFVELTLKWLIHVGSLLTDRELTDKETKLRTESHDLSLLWDTFKTIAREVEKETGVDAPPQEDFEGIESYIAQIHAVDRGSFTFRYPLTKKGEVSVGQIKRINLGRFCEHMEGLCDYLDGFDMYYQHLIELRDDILNDYAPDYDYGY
jgi:hypothetical protein